MGLFSKFISRWEKHPDQTVEALSSAEAITRTLRTMAKGAPVSVAKAGAELATALNTLETAILAIDTISDLLIEAETLAATARDTDSLGRRALTAKRYNALLEAIAIAIAHSEHNGINLLDGNRSTYEIFLDVHHRASVALHVANLTIERGGLGLTRPREDFASQTEVEKIIAEIDAARRVTSRTADLFVDSAAVMAERLSRISHEFGSEATIADIASGGMSSLAHEH
ncbi:MAG: hypothetical protein RLN89_01570 [Parvibaculum sp.]